MYPLTVNQLASVGLKSPQEAARWIGPLAKAADKAQINSAQRMAMFLAQCAHESENFSRIVENMNYSVSGLLGKFSKYFDSATAERYGRKPGQVANQPEIARIAYGGRMGNDKLADGWNYRGRGLIGLTGKANYVEFFAWAGLPANTPPNAVESYDLSALAAAWYWQKHDLNVYADRGDIESCSRVINCGPNSNKSAIANGLADRKAKYSKILTALKGHFQ